MGIPFAAGGAGSFSRSESVPVFRIRADKFIMTTTALFILTGIFWLAAINVGLHFEAIMSVKTALFKGLNHQSVIEDATQFIGEVEGGNVREVLCGRDGLDTVISIVYTEA